MNAVLFASFGYLKVTFASFELRIVVGKLDLTSIAGSLRLVDAEISRLEKSKKRSAAEMLAAVAAQGILKKVKENQYDGCRKMSHSYAEWKREFTTRSGAEMTQAQRTLIEETLDKILQYNKQDFEQKLKELLSAVGLPKTTISYFAGSGGFKVVSSV